MPTSRIKLSLSDGSKRLRAIARELAEDEGIWFEIENTGTVDIFPSTLSTVDVLYIESSAAITINQNSSATSITIDANGFLLIWGGSITALTATGTANLKIYMAGT